MEDDANKIAAYKTLTAAFLYILKINGTPLRSAALDFGKANLGNGNTTPHVNTALKTIFGEDAPQL